MCLPDHGCSDDNPEVVERVSQYVDQDRLRPKVMLFVGSLVLTLRGAVMFVIVIVAMTVIVTVVMIMILVVVMVAVVVREQLLPQAFLLCFDMMTMTELVVLNLIRTVSRDRHARTRNLRSASHQ